MMVAVTHVNERATIRRGSWTRTGLIRKVVHGLIVFREDGRQDDRLFEAKYWSIEPEADCHCEECMSVRRWGADA